ncbi:MAG: hypothetical protein VKJ46_07580 [Leptolyngbyaceae bacterium]|nr:hypothetical protein [Leptolyngbyaceae bacterium]
MPIQYQEAQATQQRVSEGLKRLEAQAQHINQLSTDIEVALFELKEISAQVHREQKALRQSDGTAFPEMDKPPVYECSIATVPQIQPREDGSLVLNMRQIDLLRAEREAEINAQFLRQRAHQKRLMPLQDQNHAQEFLAKTARGAIPSVSFAIAPPFRRWLKSVLDLPQGMSARVSDGVVWIVAAAVIRLGLQVIVNAYPALWMPAVLVLITPALIATYQITFMTQSGLILGYRLLLLLVGLLLGGRF